MDSLGGLPEALPFVILFIVLLVLPPLQAGRPARTPRPARRCSGTDRRACGSAPASSCSALLALVPVLFEDKLAFFVFGLCQAMLILSLGLLVKTSGQMSLCHATFAAIGGGGLLAVARRRRAAVVGGVLPRRARSACPVGAIVALPAIRLHGVYLALATFGFGILIQRAVLPAELDVLHVRRLTARLPRPFGITTDGATTTSCSPCSSSSR